MGLICFHLLVLGGWRTKQRSPECFLLFVQVPSSEFCKTFSKEVQFSQWYSRVTQGVWSSHGVWVLNPLFPTSKADMWSSWVGKCYIPWLPILSSRMVIHEGLELNQILVLWKVKCPGKRKEMDWHLGRKLVFLFELHVLQLFGRVGLFFSHFQHFFRE